MEFQNIELRHKSFAFGFVRSIALLLLTTIFTGGYAQHQTTSPALSQLLSDYYEIKDALVSGDANGAAASAAEMLHRINEMKIASLPDQDQKAYKPLQYKLEYDARHISEVKELSHQREHFEALSLNMFELAKAAKLSSVPVYRQFCPMKNAYWLSNEKAIKNPYYGAQMLSCGSVTDTLK